MVVSLSTVKYVFAIFRSVVRLCVWFIVQWSRVSYYLSSFIHVDSSKSYDRPLSLGPSHWKLCAACVLGTIAYYYYCLSGRWTAFCAVAIKLAAVSWKITLVTAFSYEKEGDERKKKAVRQVKNAFAISSLTLYPLNSSHRWPRYRQIVTNTSCLHSHTHTGTDNHAPLILQSLWIVCAFVSLFNSDHS